jgi:hypothetical protein
MSRWGYVYVENLTWVWLHANNSVLRLPSPLVSASHLTLYIFRCVRAMCVCVCVCVCVRARVAGVSAVENAAQKRSAAQHTRSPPPPARPHVTICNACAPAKPDPPRCNAQDGRQGQGHRAAAPAQPRRHLQLPAGHSGWVLCGQLRGWVCGVGWGEGEESLMSTSRAPQLTPGLPSHPGCRPL